MFLNGSAATEVGEVVVVVVVFSNDTIEKSSAIDQDKSSSESVDISK